MKTYVVRYSADGRAVSSSRYGLLADAKRRQRALTDRGIQSVIETSFLYPQIFPHCPNAGSAAIGSVCDLCGRIITIEDAKKWRGSK